MVEAQLGFYLARLLGEAEHQNCLGILTAPRLVIQFAAQQAFQCAVAASAGVQVQGALDRRLEISAARGVACRFQYFPTQYLKLLPERGEYALAPAGILI